MLFNVKNIDGKIIPTFVDFQIFTSFKERNGYFLGSFRLDIAQGFLWKCLYFDLMDFGSFKNADRKSPLVNTYLELFPIAFKYPKRVDFYKKANSLLCCLELVSSFRDKSLDISQFFNLPFSLHDSIDFDWRMNVKMKSHDYD